MAIVGILHITSIVNNPTAAQTAATAILSHLSDLYPAQPHSSFHFDHRLFVSTSSLLPHIDNKRTFTHFFVSSHSPQNAYIGTTSTPSPPTASTSTDANTTSNSDRLNIITVPTSTSLEPFTALFLQKLQPQWAARQFVISDNGVSLTLPITDDAKWTLSFADIKLATSRVSGAAAGQYRGLVIEVQYESKNNIAASLSSDEDRKKHEPLFRGFLKALFKNMKPDLKLDATKIHLTRVLDPETETDRDQSQQQVQRSQSDPPRLEVAELYMEVLRGARG